MVELDLVMPIADGLEVRRKANVGPATRDIPPIAFSAGAWRTQAMAPRCDDFLLKPSQYEELVTTPQRWMDGTPGRI